MDIKKLYELIPEYNLIRDVELKEKAALVFLQAMEEGGWNDHNIDLCPIELGTVFEECPINYIEYTRMMTTVCSKLYESYGRWINEMNTCNGDYVVVGSLLQGIGKLCEYTIDENNKPCRSKSGELFRYPWIGAYIVMENQLPKEVVHLVVSTSAKYSPGKGKVIKSPESVLVRNAELICLGIIQNIYA